MWLGAVECLAHWGIYDPGRIAALIDGKPLTYGMIAAEASERALELRQLGLRGARIAVLCREKGSFLTGLFGGQLAGCSTIVGHPTWDSETLSKTIADTNPLGFVVDQFGVEALRPQSQTAAVVRARYPSGDPSTSRLPFTYSYEQRAQDDEWGIVFSSGSTGRPKPIVQTNYSTMTECVAWCLELGLVKDQTFYVARPLYYTGGLALSLACLMTRGMLIVDNYVDDNDPRELLDSLDRAAVKQTIDRCFLVPELARAILSCSSQWPHQGNPRTILLMGSKVHVEEKRRLAELFGSAVIESWGNSEGLGTITDAADLDTRPSSIGRPFLTERLWIMNDELSELPSTAIGRIVGSDETMFKEYANQPDATDSAKRNDYVVSDDVGFRDASGYFHILGRQEDVVVLNGVVLTMPALENDIRALDGVRDAYVLVSKSNDPLVLTAVVAGEPSLDSVRIRSDVEEVIRRVLKTEPFELNLKLVPSIPKLSSGKTDRIRARALAAEQRR